MPEDEIKYQEIPENPESLRAPADDVRKHLLGRYIPMELVVKSQKWEEIENA